MATSSTKPCDNSDSIEVSSEEASLVRKYLGQLTMYDVEPSEIGTLYSVRTKMHRLVEVPDA